MKYLLLIPAMILAGCSSSGESAQTLLQQLEFEDGEKGCVRLQATIDLNPAPLLTTNAQMIYKKSTGDDAPEC